MIEIVDGLRRPFGIADPFEAHHRMGLAPIHHPGPMTAPPLEHRTLVHWNANQSTTQPENSKTDEDEEDDDDRPFTPPPPRERLSYTRYQLELLNAIYTEVRYPNSTQKQLIAKRVGITRDQVKIWFQNRRRKDVVGNTGKSKSCDTSTSSVGSSKDSGIASPTPDGNESSSSSDDISSQKDTEESVVPDVVMKSVINELKKFVNDPLKGKKNKKKYKAKKKDQNAIKKGLSATLLSGSYDMISPPNQITPSAFFEKLRNGFNHSKSSSAFANPRDSSKPSQSSIHPSLSTSESVTQHSKTVQCGMSDYLPFSSRQHPLTGGPSVSSNYPPNTVSQSSEMSSLADILSYKSCLEARHKEMMSSAQNGPMPSAITSPPNMHRLDTQRTFHPGPVGPSTPGRYIPGIYPYPFLAEQPMLLSSLRQPDHLFRPAPQYALSHYTDDPYQPLLISSLSNPYYSPPSSCWSSQTLQSPPTNSPL